MADAYSLVGFQNHLRYGEQARVLRLIPGMENAEFLQFGQIHRNTYICSPRVLAATMQMRERPNVFFAGQITGVEGYVESVAMGWIAGVNAARLAMKQPLIQAPPLSAIGALARYVSNAQTKNFQPVNITFALLEPLAEQDRKRVRRKRDRHQLQVELALKEWDNWLQHIQSPALQAFALSHNSFQRIVACRQSFCCLASSSRLLVLRNPDGTRTRQPSLRPQNVNLLPSLRRNRPHLAARRFLILKRRQETLDHGRQATRLNLRIPCGSVPTSCRFPLPWLTRGVLWSRASSWKTLSCESTAR